MPVEKKHDFTRREIQAGLLVIATVAVLAGFVVLIQGWRPEKPMDVFYAQFANTIGLKVGAEVRFGGMIAGKVEGIQPDPEDRDKIRVAFAIEPSIPVNDESIATIETLSLTSDKHLEISTGTPEAPLLEPGSITKSVTKSGGFVDIPNMDGLVSGSEDLIGDLRELLGVEEALAKEETGEEEMASVTRITQDVRNLLGVKEAEEKEAAGEQEMASVTRITQDLRDMFGVQEAKAAEAAGGEKLVTLTDITGEVGGLFERYQPQLDEIVGKLPPMQDSAKALLDELNAALTDNRDNLDATLENVTGITEKLNAELNNLMTQLNETLNNTENLTGDLSGFVATNRPVLEDLLGDLALAVQNLGVFMQELKNQPQSVVWGKPALGRKN
ncbi:MAG: hypothetical protein RLZZ303_383 [Candidatus Hydrogenedentota bacterium]